MYASLGVSREVYEFGQSVLDSLKARFEGIDAVAEYNQAKVIRAMQEHRVDATCFAATTGYGYDDLGRDKLERVYASAFGTEAGSSVFSVSSVVVSAGVVSAGVVSAGVSSVVLDAQATMLRTMRTASSSAMIFFIFVPPIIFCMSLADIAAFWAA